MKKNSTKVLFSSVKYYYIILFLITLIIYLSIFAGQEIRVFANSPSFPIQNIIDEGYFWTMAPNSTDWNKYPEVTENVSACDPLSNNPSDISSVNYMSDGKYLNATIWLVSATEPHFNYIDREFAMQIDVKSFYDSLGADYGIAVAWDNNTSTWTKQLVEYDAYPYSDQNADLKYLKIIPQDNSSIQYGKNFVSLSLNLDDIHSPDEYRVLFAAQDSFTNNGIFCKTLDTTGFFPVPPPNYNISMSESALSLKPGQEKKILLKIKTDAVFDSFINLTSNSTHGIEVLIPSNLTVPANSMVSSLVNIKAKDNEPSVGPNHLSISSLIYPNETLYSGATEITGNLSQNLPKVDTALTVTVEEPISLIEHVSNTLAAWGAPIQQFIALVTAIGSAAAGAWVFLNKFRSKHKGKNSSSSMP